MDALQYVSDGFEFIADKFDNVAASIDGIPLIGKYLAIPFYFFSDNFQYISDLFLTVNDWWEWLKAEFLALPTFEVLINALEARFNILIKTAQDVYEWIEPYIPEIPDWIPGSFEELINEILDRIPDIPTKEDIINWVSEVFENILDRLFAEEE